MRTLYVRVEPIVRQSELHEVDRYIAGRYAIEVDNNLSNSLACSAALDQFHNQVAIKVLKDFTFFVETETGDSLIELPEFESYILKLLGSDVHQVTPKRDLQIFKTGI